MLYVSAVRTHNIKALICEPAMIKEQKQCYLFRIIYKMATKHHTYLLSSKTNLLKYQPILTQQLKQTIIDQLH